MGLAGGKGFMKPGAAASQGILLDALLDDSGTSQVIAAGNS